MTEPIISVPDLGDFDEVDVIEILVKPGDTIAEGDSVVTLESEKAAMELPAPIAGIVKTVHVALGDKVGEGAALLTVEAISKPGIPVDKTADEPRKAPSAQPPAPAPPPRRETAAGRGQAESPVKASPSIRRFARELGVDLQAVQGSGPGGRILEEDVKDFVRQTGRRPAPAALPQVRSTDFSRFGPTEVVQPDRVQSVVADRMHRAWLNVPHVTQHQDADITELEDRRKHLAAKNAGNGAKLTLLAFLVKALAISLRNFPKFNTAFDDTGRLILKHYCHIGVAVDAPGGLFVPVIRDADRKDVFEIARAVADFASRARAGKLTAADMQGGCMTVSNQGGIGGSAFTPIVNAPETAILGASRARISPSWDGQAFVPRLLLPLDLSYDHRVVNGADAARFLDGYCRLLSGTEALLPDTR